MATILIVVGMMLTGVAAASAAPRPPSKFVIIRFIPSLDEVTLTIPTPPCQGGPPGCVWRLWVNEPFAPGGPQLGVAYGSSGVLVVTYPSTVCGTVQGDASVTLQADVSVSGLGGATWRYKVGHRMVIPCTSPTPTTTPPTTSPLPPPTPGVTSTTGPSSGSTSPLPFTSGTPSVTTANDPGAGKAVETAAVATLPFTGIDLTPMVLIGMSMVLAGLLLASRFEQRRRALRRLQYSALVQRERAVRASRWFMGL